MPFDGTNFEKTPEDRRAELIKCLRGADYDPRTRIWRLELPDGTPWTWDYSRVRHWDRNLGCAAGMLRVMYPDLAPEDNLLRPHGELVGLNMDQAWKCFSAASPCLKRGSVYNVTPKNVADLLETVTSNRWVDRLRVKLYGWRCRKRGFRLPSVGLI